MNNAEMTKANMALSMQFNKYLFSHPRLMAKLPDKSTIVFVPKANPRLAKANLELGAAIKKKTRKTVTTAIKIGRIWRLGKI